MPKKIQEYIKNKFPDLEFVSAVANIGKVAVDVFFVKFKSEIELSDCWRQISNAIALYYQADLNDEFKKWNTYLFVLLEDNISKRLKYTIENDTFSNRKIVRDNLKEPLNSEIVQQLCDENIGAQGLQLHSIKKNSNYTPSPFMKSIIYDNVISWDCDEKELGYQIKEIYTLLLKDLADED